MPGNYSLVETVVTGQAITAAERNTEHQNHITFQTPAGTDDYSANLAEMQTEVDPYPAGAASLSTSLAGELARLRYVLKQVTGKTYWYEDPDTTLLGGVLKLAGAAGGQAAFGGTAASETLVLKSTSHATKGKVVFGAAGTTAYDEVNERFGIGTATPSVRLHIKNGVSGGTEQAGTRLLIEGTGTNDSIQFLTPNTEVARINFGDPENAIVGGIYYGHTSDTLNFVAANSVAVVISTADVQLNKNLLFSADNAKDIGAVGATRPRTVYVGTSVESAGAVTIDLAADGDVLIAKRSTTRVWGLFADDAESKFAIRDSGSVSRVAFQMSDGKMTAGVVPLSRVGVSGSFTTASLSAGTQDSRAITHGLGTDNVKVIVHLFGSTNTNVISYIMRPDGATCTTFGSGVTAFAALLPSTPGSGDVQFLTRNNHSAAQTVTVAYTILRES